MTDKAITEAVEHHRTALAVLAGEQWRQGRKDPCQVWAVTDDDYLNHVWIAHFATGELAAEACGAHNQSLAASG